MADLSELAGEEAVRAVVGRLARVTRYQRTNDAPMVRVIDEVQRQLSRAFSVYWVDEGPAEVFCLPQLTPSPVVFSTRYLSLTAFVRHLLVDPFSGEVVVDASERTAVKLMSEMALRHGDPDVAVLALVQSLVNEGVWTSDEDQIMLLEYEPRNEAYMATWFYGLAHELGHLHSDQHRAFPDGHALSDAGIAAAIETALQHMTSLSEPMRKEGMTRAIDQQAQSVIGVANVRAEGLADIFAASILFKTTAEVMRDDAPEPFQVLRFVQEMVIFMNIISFIDRCRRVAVIASAEREDREAAVEHLVMHPASIGARVLIQRLYLDAAAAHYVFGESPTPENMDTTRAAIDAITQGFNERISQIDTGLGRAIEFALLPGRRKTDRELLEAFRREVEDSPLARLDAERFCALADSLGVGGKLLDAVKKVLA